MVIMKSSFLSNLPHLKVTLLQKHFCIFHSQIQKIIGKTGSHLLTEQIAEIGAVYSRRFTYSKSS